MKPLLLSFCLLLLVGCSSTTSSTDTYEKAYKLDATSVPSILDLNDKVNTSITELFTQSPILKKISIKEGDFETAFLRDKSIARAVGCFPVGSNLMEQIEVVFRNGRLLYLRQDIFVGKNCNDAHTLLEVEKNYFLEDELVHQQRSNETYGILWKNRKEIMKLSKALLNAL